MAPYGKIKAQTITYDSSGSDVDVAVANIGPRIDEDDMASNSATSVPSQQSVKAYVDNQVGTAASTTGAIFTGDVVFDGETAGKDITFDRSANSLKFANEAKAQFGQTTLFHNSVDLYIQNGIGDIRFQVNSGEDSIYAKRNGAVELWHGMGGSPSQKKFETSATGIDVTGTAVTDGLTVAGDSSFTGQSDFTGQLKEAVVVSAGKLSDASNLDIEAGNVFLFTVAESTTSTPNLRYNGSTSLDSKMAVGDCLTVTIITTANASAFSAQLTIDGAAVTENWTGGSAPSAGGSSGKDIHAFTIIKTGTSGTLANDYTVIANFTKTS
tara:strand:- start:866 stop:1840 length:975 start_codon:yes stop_codon:yes gene_type:complete